MMFLALVPSEGMGREDAWEYVLDVCTEAALEAELKYQKKKLPFDAEGVIEVLEQIRKNRVRERTRLR